MPLMEDLVAAVVRPETLVLLEASWEGVNQLAQEFPDRFQTQEQPVSMELVLPLAPWAA